MFVQFYRPLPFGANAISVNSIISYHVTKQPQAWRLLPFFLRITPFDQLLCPGAFKLQEIPHTESHAIQTKGQAYSSVRVYRLLTSVSLATSIGTPRIAFCQDEVT